MAYTPHVLAEWGGRITTAGHPDEIWVNTLRLQHEATGPDPTETTYLPQVAASLLAWFTSTTYNVAAIATLDYLKINAIAATGRYADPSNVNQHVFPSGTTGRGPQQAPSFNSICYSWTTARSRGAGAHGRVYPPNFMYPSVGAFIAAADVSDLVKSATALIEVFRNAGGTTHAVPCIASAVDGSQEPITGVRVGNVYDTQRRRKNAYAEAYTSGPI